MEYLRSHTLYFPPEKEEEFLRLAGDITALLKREGLSQTFFIPSGKWVWSQEEKRYVPLPEGVPVPTNGKGLTLLSYDRIDRGKMETVFDTMDTNRHYQRLKAQLAQVVVREFSSPTVPYAASFEERCMDDN